MDDNTKIINIALDKLDPSKDEDWTAEGAPLMDRIHELTGNANITRQEVTNARSGFTRETAVIVVAEEESEVEQEAPAEEPSEKPSEEVADEPEAPAEEAEPEAPAEEAEPEVEPEAMVTTQAENDVKVTLEDRNEEEVKKAKVQEIRDRIKYLNKLVDDSQKEIQDLYTEEAEILDGYGKSLSPDKNQKAIQNYLKSSFERRLKAAEEEKELFASVGRRKPDGRSMLDKKISSANKQKRREQLNS